MNTPEESQALGKALEAAKGYADAVVKGPLSKYKLRNLRDVPLPASQLSSEGDLQNFYCLSGYLEAIVNPLSAHPDRGFLA